MSTSRGEELLVECWGHARRKFFEARKENRYLPDEVLYYIGKLYEMEREADALDEDDGKPNYDRKKALRQKKAIRRSGNSRHGWGGVNLLKCGPKSLMEKAISYTYRIIKKRSIYTTDGRYKIDGNMVENGIRLLAIGCKNYLFCGNDDAAQRAAVVYSLPTTCKVFGVDERAWLEDILRRMPEYELGKKDFAELLPGNWAAARAK